MGGTAQPRTGRRRRRAVLRAGLIGLVTAAATAAGLALPGTAAAAEDDGRPTVYIASDSTAQTYDPYWAPQMGWGQVIDRFFSEDVTIANHAIGGRSSRSFIEQGRLDAILNEIQPGDYLFVQFGHNDATISRPERYTPPEDYQEYLRNDYIAGARERGAIPVIVTPVSRRDFNAATGLFNVSFPEYVEKAVEVAEQENVPLVDLSASSRAYLDSIGPLEAKSVFLHVPPGVYPNRPNGTIDETHFQEYGAVQMARLIAQDVAGLDVPLAAEVENTGPPRERPDRPAGVTATGVSHEGARLTWDAVPGADLYRVQTRPKDDADAEFTPATTSPIPLADLGGLAESTRYEVRVIAVNGKGQSPPSAKLRLETLTADQRFDFGPVGALVADGFAGVTTETLYSPDLGYGFTDTANVISRDRGEGFDAMERDFVAYFEGRYEFKTDVPNGTYAVTAHVGDPAGASRSGFVFEGGDRGQVIPARNSVTRQTFTLVSVQDGQLNVTVYGQTGHLNGLVLTRVG
ncbi:SGNH/GDSL hydrolase family protein [Streptomyces litchfieldiae]|uniref:Fibronectin type III domain-containing protein n=1 Tax=Streptomyces litchfieldiae TaxID=3075543 RepID=A0ABU2N054_9ACTN|nr:SGNH/GDSL hydrolase family protein [Streptomyces sp. DSM 44938]MDT0346463.1 fibronectin type III domain-containing protein [Streptomyces sp. DSM 44938]